MTFCSGEHRVAKRKQPDGFTLLEMMVSLTVMLMVAGAAFAALDQSQKVYGTQEVQSDMHASLRSAFELMTQEIGQAGSLNFTPTTTSAAITAGVRRRLLPLRRRPTFSWASNSQSTRESNLEIVSVTALPATNQITGIFTLSHVSGVPVSAQGAFPNGILRPLLREIPCRYSAISMPTTPWPLSNTTATRAHPPRPER